MVMRLVRDDDYDPLELEEVQPPRTDALEPQDGVVADAAEDIDDAEDAPTELDGAEASALPDVNLGALEALLLSTHHPLTAGRIAELLDLPSTKPIRSAIKTLNEAYASTGRSFRVE